MRRYYEKNKNSATSFDGDPHYDHGILGAEHLYRNYLESIASALADSCCNQEDLSRKLNDFFSSEGIINYGYLNLDFEHFKAICKIAKIIAKNI